MSNDLWQENDFLINKHYWNNLGYQSALPIRLENLRILSEILEEFEIKFWVQGRTLEGLFLKEELPDDHDDDIGIDISSLTIFQSEVIEKLKQYEFDIIRNNFEIISIIRKKRYIDICIFKKRGKKYGYASKNFPSEYFDTLEYYDLNDIKLPVPSNTKKLLSYMYDRKLADTYNLFSIRMKKIITNKNYRSDKIKRALIKIFHFSPHYFRVLLSIFTYKLFGVGYKKIYENDFISLDIESKDSYNWKWRKPHLDIISNNKKYRKNSEIINYLSKNDTFSKLLSQVVETDTTREFYEPHNFDQRFWQSGNNYFIYNIKYQFRIGVVPYHHANDYIKSGELPLLFSKEYYSALAEMPLSEISNMLRDAPIEITNNSITGGKHRASAMIGRLIDNKSYIPLWAIYIDK